MNLALGKICSVVGQLFNFIRDQLPTEAFSIEQ